MKKQNSIYIALAIILLASLACNIGGTAPATEGGQEPAAGAGEANPVSTTGPAQEAGGNDPSAGPETIDLTTPALYINPGAPAFIYKRAVIFTGVDTTGAAKEYSDTGLVEVQSQPQITQHFLVGDLDSPEWSDTVIIGDQMTSAQMFSVNGAPPQLFCNTSLTSEINGPSMLVYTLETIAKFKEGLTGQATRVESGIEVNGFVTDKYELSGENFVNGSGEGSGERSGAFVYVARDGGFITLYEEQARDKIDFFGFDPNQFADVSIAYNFIPVEDGSLNIVIPAACNK
jgi:hypothetical protein